jgi:hypothetical protein
MNVEQLNLFLKRQVCPEVLEQLSDQTLLPLFLASVSMKRKTNRIKEILSPLQESEMKEIILQKCLVEMIPPGTKGVIRGNMFNSIVKNKIKDLNLCPNRFSIGFEKNDLHIKFDEIPDWYILDKSTQRVLIGMNQLDLWAGGHQLNRASKYIQKSMDLPVDFKLVCVVCNPIQITSEKSKVTRILQRGISENILCFVKYLPSFILSHFNLNK